MPFPSLADAGYLGSVPLTVGGLVLLTGLRDVLDGALVATSVLFISWATVLGAVVEGSTGPLSHRAIALAYPVSDVLTATLAILAVPGPRADPGGDEPARHGACGGGGVWSWSRGG